MFTVGELRDALRDDRLRRDLADVRAALATSRMSQEVILDPTAAQRLQHLVDAVLVSAPTWDHGDPGMDVAVSAAEVAESLAIAPVESDRSRSRLRAALLYELAAMPAMAAAVVKEEDGPAFLIDFFKRRQGFRSLAEEIHLNGDVGHADVSVLLRLASCEAALELAQYEHAPGSALNTHSTALEEAARHLDVDMSLTEVKAFAEVVRRRASRATRLRTPERLLSTLRAIGFPPELWETQARALDEGLLNHAFDAWSLASPTGTGKTFLARLLVIDALAHTPSSKVLYIVPTKALVHQVSRDLAESLQPTETVVTAITPQLAALDSKEQEAIAEASVLVLTPEKADLLLRIGAEFLNEVSLVVVDEAHHIEDGTRGVLLELYLARLKAALADSARYVLLSAVAPNIAEVSNWLGQRPGSALIEQRATRMKVGVYRVRREGRYNRGVIEYTDGTELEIFDRGVETGKRAGLVQLAARIGTAGPVLVVAQGQGTAEKIAADLRDRLEASGQRRLTDEQLQAPPMQRLDARLEREMYASVGLRRLVRFGVAYHHAGLPPRVRESLEDAITAGLIRYVIATTTLADGVNFPFSTVVVESLSIQNPTFEAGKPMSWRVFTPRRFWNIAGRAGRPGYDHEGQVILFEPSLGLDRVNQTIDPYTRPRLRDIPPVRSALAEGLIEMSEEVERGRFSLDDLERTELPSGLPKSAQGIVNLLRVGLAHARATGIEQDAVDYFGATYASRVLPESERAFAQRLLRQQEGVLDAYLADPGSASIKLVAELGLSIDTLSRLQKYVRDLEQWQFEALTHVLRGPQINFQQLPYVLAGVLSRMAELEGAKLSGWYSQIVVDWCSGKPFSAIKPLQNQRSLEELIRLMYSRIQYVLPWGLYATDRFVAEEAEARGLAYDFELNKLAYLVDAGVPDWAALRLTSLGFERADASRLSRAYFSSREARETADIVSWLRAQSDERLMAIVQGADRRRIDYDFFPLITELREGSSAR